METKIKSVKESYSAHLDSVTDLKSLEEFRIKYLGRNGLISEMFEEFKALPGSEKPKYGKELNVLKNTVQAAFDVVKERIEKASKAAKDSLFDPTLPPVAVNTGTKHLINQTLDEIKSIFKRIGFSIHSGPEIESDYYNFSALNFPDDHPARDMQDTFFINKNYLLRTHTTPVQIRIMETTQPPIRAIMPGKVFRNEAINARSYCLFHQVDGIVVDTNVTFSELKATLVFFAKEFYGSNIKYRFRTSFFPFTEPSAEMDITCFLCKGKGCRICKQSGWLEILGCGMVDPNVFSSVGYDNEKYTGYAFGMGIERIALLKYDIDDIRILFDNDVRFLKQFNG
ncbi:MAG: phenylalanine--tRNA ligase subunit alpha [Ignavibacteriaceae bacterium]|nr:phenylalanine--tRNA ligase subunit alpha [Ignavibacteriaceae bacterium]NUM70078.1 phenylalanine--tRNA ligase subunit alpha [Ignavibacteriaceae bacterium]